MKQFAFGLFYTLVGLTFLFVTFASIDETAVNNKTSANEFQINKSLGFTSEPTVLTEKEISAEDMQTMLQKVAFAQSVLEEFWRNEFANNGLRYSSPNVEIFQGSAGSACGSISDAAYCGADRTIYLNADFLYKQVDTVSQKLGTDGDMAAIVVMAHEYGHHTQRQVSIFNRYQELNADCMAGAFTAYSALKGVLDSDDITEAANGLAMNSEGTVWFNPNSHGTAAERVSVFYRGYNGGVGMCR
jgi:uncharacterized protein